MACYRDRMSRADKMEISRTLFGDERYLDRVGYDNVRKLKARCEGKSAEEVARIAQKVVETRIGRRDEERVKAAKWADLKGRFGGLVIGIDRDLDVFETGFSVRVLFRSDVGFEERGAFLREDRKMFLLWLMEEIMRDYVASRRIGDIRFYKPVEIINMRGPEVEVKFEVKGVA